MPKSLSSSFYLTFSLITLSCLIPLAAKAQIKEDGTTSTTVNQVGNDFTIEQGSRVGDNLFHSFEEFSVPTLGSAVFNNAADTANIFSRVTGSNISNIDGLLSANGAANLFLINPNGIIFGENARLNLGGSFFASTADSILFEGNIEFSASNPQASPLLEVDIPIGLNFRDNSGEIVNRSFVPNSTLTDFVGLEVAPGQNLTLVGGNISFEAGEATARGGNIQLGGLSEAGTVGINEDGSLNFPEDVAQADITLSNAADIDARGTGNGGITISTRNLNLEAGEFGFSRIRAGITGDSTSTDAQAGNITINATENVTIDDSIIENNVNEEAVGNAGDITITTGNLNLTNGGLVDTSTFGQGNAGLVNITASDTITIDGENSAAFPSGAYSDVFGQAVGDAGGITITTSNLNLTNGGQVDVSTFGQGNAGSVNITASDTITIDGEASEGPTSGVASTVQPEAVGNAGSVTITTGNLNLTNGGGVTTGTLSQGNAGSVNITASDTITIDGTALDGFASGAISRVNSAAVGDAGGVTINTSSLTLSNGGEVSVSTFGQGDAGSVNITASDTITIDGENPITGPSGAFSQVIPGAVGNAGDINIDTGSLSLTSGGRVDTSTGGQGIAGSVQITASDTITIDGETSGGFPSGAFSSVAPGALGNAGGIIITTGSLSLTNGGVINASILFGQGNAGSVQITASDITLSNAANVDVRGTGGGSIIINARNLNLEEGEFGISFIRTGITEDSTSADAQAGDITINSTNNITVDGSSILNAVRPGAVGNAGDINIDTGSLTLTNGGQVTVNTFGQGNAGSVEITASDTITIDGRDLDGNPSSVGNQVASEAVGFTEGVTINTDSLYLTNGGRVSASTGGQGNAGSVEITATDTILIDGEWSDGNTIRASGVASQVNSEAVGDAGSVTITTSSLTLTNGGGVSANTFGQGSAGLVEITASDTIIIDGENSRGSSPSGVTSGVASSAVGDGGGVTINTASLTLTNGGAVSVITEGQGNAGLVEITTTNTMIIDGETSGGFPSVVSSGVNPGAVGDAGGVTINTDSLTLTNGGAVSVNTFGQGNAGSVEITASDTITIDGKSLDGSPSGVGTQVTSEEAEGDAGGVTITTGSLSLTNGGIVSASTFGQGNAGSVEITANDAIMIDGEDSDGFPSGVSSEVGLEAEGDAGGVTINTDSLSLTNGGTVSVSTFGRGNAGSIEITATDTILIDGEDLSGIPSGANSVVDLRAEGDAGGVTITTGSLSLTNGGVVDASTFGQGNAGLVEIFATDTILIDGEDLSGIPSGARSRVNSGAVGDAEGVTINTGSLSLTNGGVVDASTFGQGNAGSVKISATDTILIDGEDLSGIPSGARSEVNPGAVGDAGGVTITTGSLSLTNGGLVNASTGGRGSAGLVEITANDNIMIDGENSRGSSPSGVGSQISPEAVGNTGGVTITTGSLTLTNGGVVDASTFGQGNAGLVEISATDTILIDGEDLSGISSGARSRVNSGAVGDAEGVTINTGSLSLTNGGVVDASTRGKGNAGSVKISATDTILIDGETSGGIPSGVFIQVGSGALGDAEGVTITTISLSMTNGGLVNANTLGRGNAGSVEIAATDTILIDGETLGGIPSGVFIQVVPGAVGDAGGVTINTGSLSLTNGGQVDASTGGQGNAGLVEISTTNTFMIDGEQSGGFASGVGSVVNPGAVGDARGITITTGSLSLTNGGEVSASTFGQGNAGLVEISATDTILIDGEGFFPGNVSNVSSTVQPEAVGNAGDVKINTGSLALTNGGEVIASTFGQGNGGSIEINASDAVMIDGELLDGSPSSVASQVVPEAVGNAGGVIINTGSLTLTNGGGVSASTFGQGNGGSIEINASDAIIIDGEQSGGFVSSIGSLVGLDGEGDAGDMTINTSSLTLTNGGRVSTSTGGQGNAGDLTVNATESITISGATDLFRSGISADAFVSNGNGGDVNVLTNRLIIDDSGTIEAGNFDNLGVFAPGTGQPGNIKIQAHSLSLSDRASIEAATQSEIGEAAIINLTIDEDIILANNSLISATALGNANGGNVIISADDGSIVAFPNQNNDIIANADRGNGGDINITTLAIFGLEERSSTPTNQTNDIDASSEFGLQGDVSVNTPEVDPTSGLIELPDAVGDASDQISQNPCEQGVGSEFIITGKGGLPSNPNETLNSNRVRVDLVEPVPLQQEEEMNEDKNSIRPENPNSEAVPVQGLIFNDKGQVMLTSYKTTDTEIERSPQQISNSCSVR